MQRITLSNSNLNVSRICFGGEQLGGFDWGSYDLNKTIETAEKAIEYGINFFDTADCYGLGDSEKNLGKIIAKSQRDKLVISSKFGVKINPNSATSRVTYDNSETYIKKALHDSLTRLNTDYLDLYQVHYWDKITPLEEVFASLERLCETGKIRYYGISNFSCLDLNLKYFPHLISFSYEYSLANRDKENLINNHLREGLSFLSFGALGQGILTGKYDKSTIFDSKDRRSKGKYINFFGEKLNHNLRIVEVMKQVSKNYKDVSVAQIALRYVLDKLPNTVLITGIKKLKQLEDNLSIFNFQLKKEDIDALNKISLTHSNT